MFDPGTKIILVESSLHKTVGPRKGSIGYISNCYDTRTFNLIKEGFDYVSVIASLCEVLFIRFGFEERGRMERKTIIALFPIFKSGGVKKAKNKENELNPIKSMANLCQLITSQKDSYLWENIKANYETSPSIPVVVASPLNYDNTDLTMCDDIEFKAWILSYMTNTIMSKLVRGTRQSGHFSKSNDNELSSKGTWDELQLFIDDRSYRGDCVNRWASSAEARAKSISLIRKIMAVQSRSFMKKAMEDINNIHNIDMHDYVTTIYNTICPYMYNKLVMSLFAKLCYNFNVPEISATIGEIEAIISECTALSDSMLKTNNGFGYTSLISK